MQKIISVGNSAAITLPKGFLEEVRLKIGDKVRVKTDSNSKTMIIEPCFDKGEAKLSKDFVDWTSEFIEKQRLVLEELASK